MVALAVCTFIIQLLLQALGGTISFWDRVAGRGGSARGFSSADEPRAPAGPNSVASAIGGESLAEDRADFALQPFAVFSGESDDLSGRPKRQSELDRLVQIAADADIGVKARKLDVLESGALQQIADHVGGRHGERTRAAMHLIGLLVSDHWDDLPDAKLGFVQPRIVFAPAPYDHRQSAVGSKCLPNVAQRGSRQIEEHGAEAGKNMVIGTAKIVALHVGYEEKSVADQCFRGFACRRVDEVLRAVHTNGFAADTDIRCHPTRRVAETATHVEHARARRIRLAPEHLLTMTGKTPTQDVTEAAEFIEQHGVPCLDGNRVVAGGRS